MILENLIYLFRHFSNGRLIIPIMMFILGVLVILFVAWNSWKLWKRRKDGRVILFSAIFFGMVLSVYFFGLNFITEKLIIASDPSYQQVVASMDRGNGNLYGLLHTPLGVIILILMTISLLSYVHKMFNKSLREGDERLLNRLQNIPIVMIIVLIVISYIQNQTDKSTPPSKPQKSFEEVYGDLSKSGRPVSVTIGSNTNDPNRNILSDLNLSDKTVYYYSGDLVIESKNDFVSVRGGTADILVSGNLYINSNMRYENKEPENPPRFTVKGDVFISGNVTKTVGSIVDYGTLNTGK